MPKLEQMNIHRVPVGHGYFSTIWPNDFNDMRTSEPAFVIAKAGYFLHVWVRIVLFCFAKSILTFFSSFRCWLKNLSGQCRIFFKHINLIFQPFLLSWQHSSQVYPKIFNSVFLLLETPFKKEITGSEKLLRT